MSWSFSSAGYSVSTSPLPGLRGAAGLLTPPRVSDRRLSEGTVRLLTALLMM